MKHFANACFLACLLTVMTSSAMAEADIDQVALKSEAAHIVQIFAEQLKPKLRMAMQTGGVLHAIEVCSVEAPQIARSLSEKTGWNVKRVSLKARNTSTAMPDVFERMVLEQFNQRQASGEPVSSITYAGVFDSDYRFMKAQGVEGVCLNCHGDSLPLEVKKALAERYPDDMATGYSLGQVRGAFSLTKAL